MLFGRSDNEVKTIVKIPDMMCSMCESHINDAIRRAFTVKKVKSSHRKGETVIVSDSPIPEDDLRKVIGETGYTVESVKTE